MTTETLPAVRTYLARVRTALADLPSSEIDDVVEDVRPHLAEITEELGEDLQLEGLIERLGTPESYAAELRAAGDYPPPPAEGVSPGKRGRFAARLALWTMLASAVALAFIGGIAGAALEGTVLFCVLLVAPVLIAGAVYVRRNGIGALAELPEIRFFSQRSDDTATNEDNPARRYLRNLVPAVWPLCTVVFLGLIVALALGENTEVFLAIPLLAIATGLVLWAGPKSSHDGRLLWASLPVAAMAAGAAIGMAGNYAEVVSQSQYPVAQAEYDTRNMVNGQPRLYYGDQLVRNLYVFDAEGQPLSDVYVYDAQGRPILLPRKDCDPRTPDSAQRDNNFPRPQIKWRYRDGGRVCHKVEGVPFTVGVPKQTPSSTPTTPSPSAEPTERGNSPSKPAEPGEKGKTSAPDKTTEPAKPTK